MQEQITYYRDERKLSPFCYRVEIALLEAGASYIAHGFDIFHKPAWFAQVNPTTGNIPVITYGGPNVHPEQPSPKSVKLTESLVILEFIADLFPDSKLLPPVSDPTARARVRSLINVFARSVEAPSMELLRGRAGYDKVIEGLERFQALLPDPDAADGGKFAIGKQFTIADCATLPILTMLDVICKTDLGRFEPGMGNKLKEAMAVPGKFDRLKRYEKALLERESVKKVVDLDHLENTWRVVFSRRKRRVTKMSNL